MKIPFTVPEGAASLLWHGISPEAAGTRVHRATDEEFDQGFFEVDLSRFEEASGIKFWFGDYGGFQLPGIDRVEVTSVKFYGDRKVMT